MLKILWKVLWDWFSVALILVAWVYAFVFSYTGQFDKATFFLLMGAIGIYLRHEDGK